MTHPTQDFTWWKRALKGEAVAVHEDPECGFYRKKGYEAGQWEPVAIWVDDEGAFRAMIGNEKEADPEEIWSWCCQHPVSYSEYEKAVKEGQFSDQPPPIKHIGSEGNHEELKAITAELDAERDLIASEGHIAPKAAAWCKRVGKLKKRADDTRKAEIKPLQDHVKAINDKWHKVIAAADELKAKIGDAK